MKLNEYKDKSPSERSCILREIMLELRECSAFSVEFESDVNDAGEQCGLFHVTAYAPGHRRIEHKGDYLEYVLVELADMLDAKNVEAEAERQAERRAALAKLTNDERRILGIHE